MGKWIAILSLIWLVSFIISLAFIWKKVPKRPFTSGRELRNSEPPGIYTTVFLRI